MAYKTKLRKIGNSLGIVIPKEALQAMKVEEGETLYITEAPEGAVQVTSANPAFEEKAQIADSLMKRYRNALRELAK
jgi:putative addiction module antidote